MELNEFLTWLATGAGAVAAFSFLVELIPAWDLIDSSEKRVYSAAGSVVVAMLAFVGLQYIPADVIALVDPYFKLIVGVLTIHFGGQVFHQATKK